MSTNTAAVETVLIDCPDCDGSGQADCECIECGDIHDVDCKHCKGTGEVKATDDPLGEPAKGSVRAKDRWHEFKDELTFKPSPDAFRAAYRQMFGRPASDDTVNEWWGRVKVMAERAGEHLA